MATNAPQTPAPTAPAPPKKTSPLIWILVGCGGLILIVCVMMLAGGLFVAHKAKGYLETAKKNPAMAAAKIAVAVNPDLEVVAEDDAKGELTIRNKKTGEEITMNAQDIKQGRLKFKNEKGEEVTFEGSGQPGKEGLRIKSVKGSMTFGAGAAEKAPPWVPMYPGGKVMASASETTVTGLSGHISFQTDDATDKIMAFYERELKANGFTVERTSMQGTVRLANLNAKADGGKRTVNVVVTPIGEASQVAVQFTGPGSAE
ncbi:MAG TPA: hypothetical protein VMT19_08825 [Thermoanaerobaculaceae bacterium]|nr:hypothetical protein [Thermoanaerobaculaceae bacterium]